MLFLTALLMASVAAPSISGVRKELQAAPAAAQVVVCRVLESHTSANPAVTIVVFHQKDAKDREALSALLRGHSGSSVKFQAGDGEWHSATVARLKSCFGRGLLIFPAGTAPLEEKDIFVLNFSMN